MTVKRMDLDFISLINRDGSGVRILSENERMGMNLESGFRSFDDYELHRLSITEDTYLAFNMNVYVVKLKNKIE